MKNYAKRITELEGKMSTNKDAISEVMKVAETEGRDLTEVEMETINQAKAAMNDASSQLEVVKAAQEALQTTISAPAVVKNVQIREIKRPKADFIIKSATANLIAHVNQSRADIVAESIYSKDAEAIDFIKAAVNPARTDVAGWAQELQQEQYGEFLEALRPMSFYAHLAAMGTAIPFGGGQSVTFPSEGATGGLAGQFVGEGHLIPVGKAALSSLTLTRKKMAIISNFTREALRSSVPSLEPLVRDIILKDTATAIDSALISNTAASAVAPAGLLNGVTGTASAGNTVANIVTDIKAAVNPLLDAGSNAANIVLLMNDAHLLGLSTVTTAAGTFAFKADIAAGNLVGFNFMTSRNIPKGTLVAVDAYSFASSFDSPEFETSNSAVIIQADKEATKPDLDDYDIVDPQGTATNQKDQSTIGKAAVDSSNKPNISTMFQQDMVALRMVMPLSWGMRRGGAVAAITSVAW